MNQSSEIRNFLMLAFIIVTMVMCGVNDVSADTTCVYTGNVEVNISPESRLSSVVAFSFSNNNDYQVTVNVVFHLLDVNGNTKAISRVLVIAAKSSREVRFDSSILEMGVFKPMDCKSEMTVQKCG